MQVEPRYAEPAVLRFDPPVADPSSMLIRQRRRLGDALAALDDAQWKAPSRCELWTVQDVIAHLIGTNQFWTLSIEAGLAGRPTRYLATFDPVATPAQMVEPMRTMTPAQVLAQYEETAAALADVVTGLDAATWSRPAEAPPGHIALHAVALHALWDAWIHERDVLLPLGLAPAVEPDEVEACLRYATAIGPAILASSGSTRTGVLGVQATDPSVSLVVEVGATVVVRDGPIPAGAPCVSGDAVALVEGLTFRAPLEHALSADDVWLLGALGVVFGR